jgi:TM2 domain-containing membrane protein YozV
MTHPWRQNLDAALLNLIVPGWGQFEQGRPRRGWLFLIATGLALLALWAAPLLRWPALLPLLDLAGVAAWSVIDALLWRAGDRVGVR